MSVQKKIANINFSKKMSIQFTKVFIICICWLFVGLLISIYDHFLLSSELSSGYTENYSFLKNLAFNLSASFIGALLGSTWLIFYVNEKLRDKPYGYTLITVALSFFIIIAIVAFILGMLFVKYETGNWPYTDAFSTQQLHKNLTNPFHLKNMVVWANIVLLTQFILQVNDKFGQGLLFAFINGKYHSPKNEKRIFMFVDLIDSTRIAEQLGNESYYNLLKDFFADITDSIIYNEGKIYQYVGDEVVISWKYNDKVAHHHFLNCYFDMRKAIRSRMEKYQDNYGLVPDFKAAIHYGAVTVGEVGIIKRDLTFSGDVLNTTSRILTFCKEYDSKLLISEKLYQYINQLDTHFTFVEMGEELLRGKSKKVKIYSVLQTSNS